MKRNDAEDLALAVGLVIGAGYGTPCDGTATRHSGSQAEQYKISVHPRALYWKTENMGTGEVRSFDPETMRIQTGGESIRLQLDQVPFSFHDSVKLAFPLSLKIWGRKNDVYAPVGLEEHGSEGVILLRRQSDPGIFGSVSFDRDSGRTTRLILPNKIWQISWN